MTSQRTLWPDADPEIEAWRSAPEAPPPPSTWPEWVWAGIRCSRCHGRYGIPANAMADCCLDCGRIGYEATR